jgi:hypothetical protein
MSFANLDPEEPRLASLSRDVTIPTYNLRIYKVGWASGTGIALLILNHWKDRGARWDGLQPWDILHIRILLSRFQRLWLTSQTSWRAKRDHPTQR